MSDGLEEVVGRSQRLINALARAFVASAETAGEKVELAIRVTQMEQRMNAYEMVLSTIEAKREAIEAKMKGKAHGMKRFYQRQLELLQVEEMAVLRQAGVTEDIPEEKVVQALTEADARLYVRDGNSFRPLAEGEKASGPVYARDGARFLKVESLPR
jgi:hypothetical protein